MNIWKRVISFVLAAVCMVSAMGSMILPAAAASGSADIREVDNVTIFNKATGQCFCHEYGKVGNGIAMWSWKYDGEGNHFNIERVKEGVSRLVTAANPSYAVDIYCPGRTLKRGLQLDVWKKGGSEAFAQNLVIEPCGDGYYYLRMAANKNLCIASSGKNKRLVLATFTGADSQKWIFKDAKGKQVVDITAASVPDPNTGTGIPASSYQKTGAVYTVSGTRFYEARTTQVYNGVQTGTLFFVDTKGNAVNNAEILNKLYTLNLFNSIREMQQESAQLWVGAAQDYYTVYTNIAATEKMGEVIGKGTGILLSIGTGNTFSLKNSVLELGEEVVSPDTLKAATFLGLVRHYAAHTVTYGNRAISAMGSAVNDYDVMAEAVSDYAECFAGIGALEYLIGDQIRELADSSVLGQLGSYFDNVVVSLADSVVPDIKAVEVTKLLTDGVVSLSEMAASCGAVAVYDRKLADHKEFLGKTYAGMKEVADRLSASDWNALVGKTIARIKNGSSYTKWYSKSVNISAKAGYLGQCTWYAWGRFHETTGIKLESAYNANQWLSANKSDTRLRILSGADKIVAGSICVDTGGKYGHVMFIEWVEFDADGKPVTVFFTECNFDGNGTYNAGKDCVLQKMSFSKFVAKRSPDGYIVAK